MSFEDRVIELLESILEIVSEGQFKPMSETVDSGSLVQRLAQEGIDVNLLDITKNEDYIMKKNPKDYWPTEQWQYVSNVLKNFGYSWVSKGEESHWTRVESSQEQSPQPRQQRRQ